MKKWDFFVGIGYALWLLYDGQSWAAAAMLIALGFWNACVEAGRGG